MHLNDILQLAAQAWHDTKVPADPEFNDCALTHRENLAAAAKAVVDSEQAFNAFDRAVLKHYLERREAQSEAERILEQHPTAHSDEVMHIASGLPHPLQELFEPFVGHAEDAQRAAVREEFPPPLNSFENANSTITVTDINGEQVVEPPPPPKRKRK